MTDLVEKSIPKRDFKPLFRAFGGPLIGILIGLLIGVVLILLAGADPISTYGALFDGAFGGKRQWTETILKSAPLLIVALGLTVAFKARVWNVGGEGQFFLGAIVGGSIALIFPQLPRSIMLPFILVGGIVGGAFWATIAGYLKIRYRVNEIISTLMLNYIAGLLLVYLARGPLNDPGSTLPESAQFVEAAQIPVLMTTRLHLGVAMAILLVPLVFLVINLTPIGHRLRAVGSNIKAAALTGVNVSRTIMIALGISGALAGLAGVIEVSYTFTRLKPNISGGYGFSAMLVALLGRLHPVGVAIAAVFFAALEIGAQSMHVVTGLPDALADAIQAVIVLAVLAADALLRRRLG